MQYLTYEEYAELGGAAVDAAGFPAAERKARALMDDWTMNRVRETCASTEDVPGCVKEAMAVAVDALPGLSGERVASFSNGQDSFTFDTARDECAELYDECCALLPASLTSRCVGGCRACA